jgi:formate hydrogenlyase subunit 4
LVLSSIEILLRAIFAALIYPGFFFLALGGFIIEGLRRGFAARIEGREVPPWLQAWFDFRRRLRRVTPVPAGKEPPEDDPDAAKMAATRREGNRLALYAIPLAGLMALALGAVLLPLPGNLWPFLPSAGQTNLRPLGADLLGVGLLLLVPALGAVLTGSLGGSVYGQLAGSRIFQLLVACGLPYAVAVFGPAIALGSLDLETVAAADSPVMLGVKALCGLLYLLCLPVILRLRPLAASHGEALEGVTTDLGGAPLALFWLMQWAERLALALLFATLYIPFAHANPLTFIPAVLFVLGVIGLIDVLFSQIRLRDALNFYLRYANPVAILLFFILAFAVKV